MALYELEFPKLGIKFTMNQTAFSIGDFSIAWYGIIIAVGFLLALWYGLRNAKRFGINPDKMIDVVIGGIIGGVIGARLYYVIFSWDNYKDNLLDIFKIWEGGLAIYGGLIGAVLAGGLVCKWRKVKFSAMLDVAGIGFLIGQAIGRWGNFVNIEAYGSNTDLPWGMWSEKIVNDYSSLSSTGSSFSPWDPVHPCFLYESLWCIAGFFLLHFLVSKRRKFDGEVFFSYLAWYGFGRMFIEGLRTDSLMLGNLRVSQLLAGLLVVFSVAFIIVVRRKIARSGDPEYLKPYVQTQGWQEELAAMEKEAQLYKERKMRKKAGLPLDDPEEETTEETAEETEAQLPDSEPESTEEGQDTQLSEAEEASESETADGEAEQDEKEKPEV